VDLVEKLAFNGQKTAKEYYNCSGFCAHHNTDIWGMTFPAGDPQGLEETTQYAPWPMSAPWLLNQLYDHYLYITDEEYKNRILPMFESCLAFYFLLNIMANLLLARLSALKINSRMQVLQLV